MKKIKKVLINFRVIILLIFLVLALVAIRPNPFAKGVAIRSVIKDSVAHSAGIPTPKPTTPPMSREVIVSINNRPIQNQNDYNNFILTLEPNRTVQIRTNKDSYRITTREKTRIIHLNETEIKFVTEEFFNETLNKTVNITKEIEVNKTITEYLGVVEDIGLRVYQAPVTNIRKGLDLQGGTRVLLQPETPLSKYDLETLMDNMRERLNVYGLSDIIIRQVGDLSGNQYISVEIAGITEEEVKDLLAKQGKFEAKISNQTVFSGGQQDIKYVCRSADCAGIDPNSGCGSFQGGQMCRFRFSITLSKEAAEQQASVTKTLDVITESDKQRYLSEKIYLYLDDELVDELNIGADLKGQATTDIQISGSGIGQTQQEAALNALNNMKRLQTILITGSLPVKLNTIKIDNISPILGEDFVKSAILVGLLAIVAVALVILIKYRKIKVAVPILITSFSEVAILLGVAALVGWNMDLAAIAGIIIAVGTGVDHQIVIADETLRGETGSIYNWKDRFKKAFFIIMGSYFTTVAAMIWLWMSGAGLLKGFAFTTIAGATIGVFVTRQAFAAMIEILIKE